MSQSDYIQYKKTGVQLKDLKREDPILTNTLYRAFITYNLENTITNTKIVYKQLIPPGKQRIFGIDKTVTSCPQFIYCRGTQARANRRPLIGWQIAPRIRRKYIKHTVNYRKHYKMRCKCKDTKCVCTPVCETCFSSPIVAPKCAAFIF